MPMGDFGPQEIPAITYSANQLARARELLSRLYGARRSASFYPPGHPATDQAIDMLLEILRTYHTEGADVVLTFFEDELLLGEQLLTEESVAFDQLIREMASIGAGSVAFLRGVTAAELGRVMVILAKDAARIEAAGGLDAMVREADLQHVIVAAVAAGEEIEGEEGEEDLEPTDKARAAYDAAIQLMRDLETLINRNGTIFAAPVRSVVRSLLDNVLHNQDALLGLTGLKDFDEYTFYHSVNVAIISLALGARITRDPRFLSSLGTGALMHDIGKIVVGAEILNKRGPLSADEWSVMRKHPLYGAERAAMTPGLDKAAVVIILEHHMRLDGCGYPQRYPERPQRLASRIVAVADSYDAMTSRRGYSAARLPDEAVGILADNAGSSLDPRIVRLFIEVMGIYPPRAVVRLTTGETAVVTGSNVGQPLRPRVRIFADAAGTVIEPIDVDLTDEEAAGGRGVERCLDASGLNVDVADFLGA
jgi:HD-GYP domain-containing protein (c-di-GMP phosphodiesterase class II)